MSIRDELELDISSAIDSVQKLAANLTQTVQDFKVGLADAVGVLADVQATVSVGADTAAFEESINEALSSDFPVEVTPDAATITSDVESAVDDADPTLQVEADTTAAQEEIDGLEGQPIEVPIDADVAPFEEGMQEVEQSSDKAGSAVSGVTTAIGSFNDTAGTTALSIGSISGSISGLAENIPVVGAVVAAFAGLGVAVDQIFQEAVSAQAAGFRFDQTFGDMASSIEEINVGDLTSDLSDLTLQLGSDDDALKSVLATFGQLGQASGASAEQVATSSEQLAALAARAVALNPALGSVDEVAQRLSTGLARGGRFAAQYGISLTAAEINARALRDTGKGATTELTLYEKAAAGAALATEKYGDSLQEVISAGAQNPQTFLKSLQQGFSEVIEAVGQPLIAPVFSVLREALPVISEFAKMAAELAEAVLPSLAVWLHATGPGLVAFGRAFIPILNFLTPVLEALAKLNSYIVPLQLLGRFFGDAGDSATGAVPGLQNLGKAGGDAGAGLQDGADGAHAFAGAADLATGSTDKLQSGLLGVIDAQDAVTQSTDSIAKAQQDQANAQRAVTDARRGEQAALRAVDDALRGVEQAQRGVADAERAHQAAVESVQAAEEKHVDALRGVEDAVKAVKQAEDDLAAARAGTSADDQLSIDQAKLRLARAQKTQTEIGAKADADALDVEQARIDVALAKRGLDQANAQAAGRVAEAEGKLLDAQSGLNKAQREAVDTAKGIVSAQDQVEQSALRVSDAQRAVGDAEQRVADARQASLDASQKIVDAEKGVADAAKRTASAYDAAARAALNLQTANDNFGVALGEQGGDSDLFVQKLEDLKQKFPQLSGPIDNYIKKFQELKGTIPAQAGEDAGQSFIGGVNGAITSGSSQIGQDFNIDWEAVGQDFVSGLQMVGSFITTQTPILVDNLTGWIGTAITEAPGKLLELGNGIVTWITTVAIPTIQTYAPVLIGALIDWITQAAQEAPGKLLELAGRIADWALQQLQSLLEFGAGLLGGILGWITKAAIEAPQRLAELEAQIVRWIVDQITQMPGRVGALATNVLGWIQTAVTEAPGKLEELAGKFLEFARSLPGRIVEGIGNLTVLLLEKGKDLIRGLFQGMLDIVNKLGSFLGPIKDRFVEAFQSAFDSHSPARVMMPIGENIAAGVVAGIDSGSSAVVAAAEDIVRQAQRQIADGPSLQVGVGGAAIPASGTLVQIGTVPIQLTVGPGTTTEQARAAGAAAASGFMDTLAVEATIA